MQIGLTAVIISTHICLSNDHIGTSLVVQGLRLPCFHCREHECDPWLGNCDPTCLGVFVFFLNLSLFLFPHLFATKWLYQMSWSSFFECWALSQLFHSFTFIKRLLSSSSLFVKRMVSSAHLRLLILLLAILIPASVSSSPAFPRSKHLLISWLQSPPAVILEPPPQI